MHEINTENRSNVETQDVTWKTHNDGKNHDSPQAVNNTTIREEYTVEEAQRQRPLVPFLATRGGGYNEEATTSLSLSLTLSHALYTSLYNCSTTTHKAVP